MLLLKRTTRVLKTMFSLSLIVGLLSAPKPVYASESHTPVVKTHITITDTLTGEKNEYDLDTAITKVTLAENGLKIYTTTVELGDSNIMPLTDQTVEDTLDGYKGSVKITYTDDGTYACLTNVVASWKKVSGNASISDKYLIYGQGLGTNSAREQLDMGDYASLSTGFKPGKYGYGAYHNLGATLGAKINSKSVTVQSNVDF